MLTLLQSSTNTHLIRFNFSLLTQFSTEEVVSLNLCSGFLFITTTTSIFVFSDLACISRVSLADDLKLKLGKTGENGKNVKNKSSNKKISNHFNLPLCVEVVNVNSKNSMKEVKEDEFLMSLTMKNGELHFISLFFHRISSSNSKKKSELLELKLKEEEKEIEEEEVNEITQTTNTSSFISSFIVKANLIKSFKTEFSSFISPSCNTYSSSTTSNSIYSFYYCFFLSKEENEEGNLTLIVITNKSEFYRITVSSSSSILLDKEEEANENKITKNNYEFTLQRIELSEFENNSTPYSIYCLVSSSSNNSNKEFYCFNTNSQIIRLEFFSISNLEESLQVKVKEIFEVNNNKIFSSYYNPFKKILIAFNSNLECFNYMCHSLLDFQTKTMKRNSCMKVIKKKNLSNLSSLVNYSNQLPPIIEYSSNMSISIIINTENINSETCISIFCYLNHLVFSKLKLKELDGFSQLIEKSTTTTPYPGSSSSLVSGTKILNSGFLFKRQARKEGVNAYLANFNENTSKFQLISEMISENTVELKDGEEYFEYEVVYITTTNGLVFLWIGLQVKLQY